MHNIKGSDSVSVSKASTFFFCASWLYTFYLEGSSNITEEGKVCVEDDFPDRLLLDMEWGDRAVNISTVFGEDVIIYPEMG